MTFEDKLKQLEALHARAEEGGGEERRKRQLGDRLRCPKPGVNR